MDSDLLCRNLDNDIIMLHNLITLQPPPTQTFQELVIPKGRHAALPYWWNYQKRTRLAMEFKFTESCRYQQPAPNHTDWEKLMGESFDWWTNHRNSVMASFRYSGDHDAIEIGVYTHISGERVIFHHPKKIDLGLPREELPVFARVPINYPVQIHLDHMDKGARPQNRIAVSIILNGVTNYVEVPFNIDIGKKTRVINPYIGRGGRKALQDTYILRRLIVNE